MKKASLLTTSVLLILTAVLSFSCVDPSDFSAYSGVNLIEGQGFDYDGTGDISQVWSKSLVDDVDDEKYLIFEEVIDAAEYGTADGLPAGSDIYRLEIPNLIPHGDFETDDATLISEGWTTDGPDAGFNTATSADRGDVPAGLSGQILEFSHSSNSQVLFGLDGYLEASNYYSIRFDFGIDDEELTDMLFAYTPDITWSESLTGDTNYTIDDIISFPMTVLPTFTAGSSGDFSIGWETGGQSQTGFIDDLRISRVDTLNVLYLDIPYLTEDRPELLSGGTYTFSLYVKHEIDDEVTPVTENRFPAEGLIMGINGMSGVTDDDDILYRDINGEAMDISGITSDSWTRLSITYSGQIDAPEDTSETVLTLSITPTDWNDSQAKTAGSLLISTPELYWEED